MAENKEQPPEHLYRYIGWRDSEHMKEVITSILVDHKMKFSAPSSFNDPFECNAVITNEGATKKDWDNLSKWQQQKKRTKKETFEDSPDKHYRIACFSEFNNNILMWPHYTRQHTGICSEFSFKGMKDFVDRQKGTINKVRYPKRNCSKSNCSIREFLTAPDDNILARKSDHWDYEQEWRIILSRDNPYQRTPVYRLFPPFMLTGIIYGCRTTKTDRNYIQKKIQEHCNSIKQYEARCNYLQNSLDISRIA